MKKTCQLLVLLVLAACAKNAQAVVKSCPAVDIQSIEETGRMIGDLPRNSPQITIDSHNSVTDHQTTLTAQGPVVGSMDARETKPEVACTNDGFVLTATIVRSANYKGATRQNVLWRSTLVIIVVPRQPPVTAHVIWEMKLSDGKAVRRARTPPYSEQRYPIAVTHTIASISGALRRDRMCAVSVLSVLPASLRECHGTPIGRRGIAATETGDSSSRKSDGLDAAVLQAPSFEGG